MAAREPLQSGRHFNRYHLTVKHFLNKNLRLAHFDSRLRGPPPQAGAILCKLLTSCNAFARHYLMLQILEVRDQLRHHVIRQTPTLRRDAHPETALRPRQLAQQRLISRIPQAQQVLLEDCGHMSLVEHPRDVAVAVAALMAPAFP